MNLRKLVWIIIIPLFGLVACYATAADLKQDTEIPLEAIYRIRHVDGFALRYPEGWYIEQVGSELMFANDIAALYDEHEFPAAGQVVGSVTYIPVSLSRTLGVGSPDDPAQALNTFLWHLNAEVLIEDVERILFTRNGKTGAYATNHLTDGSRDAEGIFIAVPEQEGYTILIVLVAEDVFDTYLETILAIAGSVELHLVPTDDVPALVSTVDFPLNRTIRTSSDGLGAVTMSYPDMWVAEETTEGVITFASDWGTMFSDSVIPESGRVLGQLIILPGDSITTILDVAPDSTPVDILTTLLKNDAASAGLTRNSRKMTIRGHEAALMMVSLVNDQVVASGILLAIQEDDGYSIFSVNTPHGEYGRYVAVLLNMAESLTFEGAG